MNLTEHRWHSIDSFCFNLCATIYNLLATLLQHTHYIKGRTATEAK
jgi:hypothetical protein